MGSMRSCSSSSKFSLLAMIVTLSIDPRRHKFVFGNPVTFYSYSNVFAGLGENMSPFCADFNDDGLNDCIVGTKSNDVAYFENTGSASTFTFASGASPTQSNFLEFSSGDLTYSTPFCADMDNDGDLDCLIGSSDGMIYYKENRGTASTADFTNSFDSSDYFNKDLGDYSSVTCYDLDNDGDYDCILGDEEGDIYYFENFGSAESASFGSSTKNVLFSLDGESCTFSKINCIDLDNDGDADCIVGCADGNIYYFANTGDISNPSFGDDPDDSSYISNVGTFASPFCIDMDNDDAPDCFVGTRYSPAHYADGNAYPTSRPSTSPTWVPMPEPTSNPTSSLPTSSPSSNPTTAPSSAPTTAPSPAPSLAPTNAPSPAPTIAPSFVPTLDCANGKFYDSATSSCLPCSAGSYSDVSTAKGTCQLCPRGKFSSGAGSSFCDVCAAGTSANETGSSNCTDCDVGKFAATSGLSLCSDCPTGTITDIAGLSICSDCLAGTVATEAGLSTCTSCTAGKIAASDGLSTCTDCDAGKFAATSGLSLCSDCPTGTFTDSTGSTACTLCNAGYYNSELGSTSCLSCEEFVSSKNAYYYAREQGQAECDPANCNGQAGVKEFDYISGACTCSFGFVDSKSGLSQPPDGDDPADSPDCKEEQQIEMSIIVSFVGFGIFIVIFIPLVFCGGCLAIVSGTWRKDLTSVIHEMRLIHTTASALRSREATEKSAKTQDKYLRNCFERISGNKNSANFEEIFGERSSLQILMKEKHSFECNDIHMLKSTYDHAEYLTEIKIQRKDVQSKDVKLLNDGFEQGQEKIKQIRGYVGLDFNGFRELVSVIAQLEAELRALKENKLDFFSHHTRSELKRKKSILKNCPTKRRASIESEFERKEEISFDDYHKLIQSDAFTARVQDFARSAQKRQSVMREAYKHVKDLFRAIRHTGLAITSNEVDELREQVGDPREVTENHFRRICALACLNRAKVSWPGELYVKEFEGFELSENGAKSGKMEIEGIQKLLENILGDQRSRDSRHLGLGLEDDNIEKIKEALSSINQFGAGAVDCNYLYFDDLLELMSIYHDESLVADIVEKLHGLSGRLLREIYFLIFRLCTMIPIIILVMCFAFFNFVIDIYLIAQSWYDPNDLKERFASYVDAVDFLIPTVKIPFEWMLALVEVIGFDFDVSGGVTCEAMQAPLYLAINVLIVAIVVSIFDSGVFTVLRVLPEDYRHAEASILTKDNCCRNLPKCFGSCFLSERTARITEEYVVRGTAFGAARTLKYFLQLLIAKSSFKLFIFHYKHFTKACETKYPYTETIAQVGASTLFWILAPWMLHLLLNTFVYGVGPPEIDKEYKKKISLENFKKRSILSNIGSEFTPSAESWHYVASSMIPRSYRSEPEEASDADEKEKKCSFYCCCKHAAFRLCCSFARCFCDTWIEDANSEDEGKEKKKKTDLFIREPLFFQQPKKWFAYYYSQARISTKTEVSFCRTVIVALSKYLYAMGWKVKLLVSMTLGRWDWTLIQNMEIIGRCERLRINVNGEDTKHENIFSAIGCSHTLIWQFIPGMVVLSKLGEALNEAPLFVFDPTSSRIISSRTIQRWDKVKELEVEKFESGGGAPTNDVSDEEPSKSTEKTKQRGENRTQGGNDRSPASNVTAKPPSLSPPVPPGSPHPTSHQLDPPVPMRHLSVIATDQNTANLGTALTAKKLDAKEKSDVVYKGQVVYGGELQCKGMGRRPISLTFQNQEEHLMEEKYWVLKVPNDNNDDTKGMLVWFQAGDSDAENIRRRQGGIGTCCLCKVFCTCCAHSHKYNSNKTSRVGVKSNLCGGVRKYLFTGDHSYVEFIQHDNSDESDTYVSGKPDKDLSVRELDYKERYGLGLASRHRYMYDGERSKFSGLADTRKRFAALPTSREPMFIPANVCIVRFHSPYYPRASKKEGRENGKTYHNTDFTLHAIPCYTQPVTFRTSFRRRRLHWMIYTTMFIAKCLLVFSTSDVWQIRGLLIFLLACVILGIDYALEFYNHLASSRKYSNIIWESRSWVVLKNNLCACFFSKGGSRTEGGRSTVERPEFDTSVEMAARRDGSFNRIP